MTYSATVLTVLIASPGDTQNERNEILREISRWNGRNGETRGFILNPWFYELHATPRLGGRAQAIINQQGVDKADVVVAVFGHRLGTDTGLDVSGTAEEINRARERDRAVHVFFSASELPNDVDTEQLDALRAFKRDMETEGLLGEYRDAGDLARQVRDALEYDLDDTEHVDPPAPPPKVDLFVDFIHETEPSVDSKGRPKTKHLRRDIVVKNVGNQVAEQLSITLEPSTDNDDVIFPSSNEGGASAPADLTPGSSFAYSCIPFQGRASVKVHAEWIEQGEIRAGDWVTQVV